MGDDLSRLIDASTATLQERGERMTEPRSAVLRVIMGRSDHLTSEQIVDRVQEASPTVHRASVYRALETLSHAGILQHIHVAHGATVYHLVDSEGPHVHAQCRQCNMILDLSRGSLGSLINEARDSYGFEIDPNHIAFSGLCAECAATLAG